MAKVISLEAARKRKIQRKASPTQEEILKICEQLIREMEQNPICDEEWVKPRF